MVIWPSIATNDVSAGRASWAHQMQLALTVSIVVVVAVVVTPCVVGDVPHISRFAVVQQRLVRVAAKVTIAYSLPKHGDKLG